MKTNELSIMDNIELLYEYPVILYGAGSGGGDAAELLQGAAMRLEGFADSDVLKWGGVKCNLPIFSPYQLKERCESEKVIVIITVGSGVDGILEVMEKLEIRPYIVATRFALIYAMHLYSDCKRFPKDFAERRKLVQRVYMENNELEGRTNPWRMNIECNKTLLTKHPILVYQPGKVGSLAIFGQLAKLRMPVVHLHQMSKETTGIETIFSKIDVPVKIITGVREPMSRIISAYCHPIRFGWPFGYSAVLYNLLKDGFCEAFLKYVEGLCPAFLLDEFGWFDKELKKYCGVDIYAYPFDQEQGYSIIEQGNVQVFVYKMEDLDRIGDKLRDFVENPQFSVRHGNAAEDFLYKYAYKEFKEKVKIPAEFFWKHYNSEKMRHFYTEKEMEMMRDKWEGRLADSV